MNPTDIYCRKKGRRGMIEKGLDPVSAFVISEYVNSVVQEALKESEKRNGS